MTDRQRILHWCMLHILHVVHGLPQIFTSVASYVRNVRDTILTAVAGICHEGGITCIIWYSVFLSER
jgi:hypothetical protein